ncbi:MAG: DUF4162 domain-containing protein, partial [Deltaproteobacteria bacterium]|nr:DUF4162 domain-containing protein [Deltaproteobacteria bacterium]
ADKVHIQLSRPAPAELGQRLRAEPWVRQLDEEGRELQLGVEQGETRIARLLELIRQHGEQVERVDLHRPTLEDAFLQLTGASLEEIDGATAAETIGERFRRQLWRK